MGWRVIVSKLCLGLGLIALAACDMVPPPPSTNPRARPSGLVKPAPKPPSGPSVQSLALTRYYGRVQASQLAQDLLRTGGGGVDTPYTDVDLARNFETIAFYDEHDQAGGLKSSDGRAAALRKWVIPVRISVEFGDSVPDDQRITDRAAVTQYAARLARITRHPISVVNSSPNFHVLVMGEDDRAQVIRRVRQIAPEINTANINMLQTLPKTIHCLVLGFVGTKEDFSYRRAVALIRSEHPELSRRACIHEEVAQGLGLVNDSPRARPSIFNDDDEFALLTTQDEELLRLLYDPALKPGMSADEARPIFRGLIAARRGPS